MFQKPGHDAVECSVFADPVLRTAQSVDVVSILHKARDAIIAAKKALRLQCHHVIE